MLLSDLPIDWDHVKSAEDHRRWIEMREAFPAALIQTEVLAKERRALIVYGQMHFLRKNLRSNYDMEPWQAQTIVSLLERAGPARVFTIWAQGAGLERLQPGAASWDIPSLALTRGTVLGAEDFSTYGAAASRVSIGDNGRLIPVPRQQWRSLRMEDQFDAVLYTGPPAADREMPPNPALCSDSAYIEKRLARMAFVGLPKPEADQLKQYCAAQTR